MKSGDEAFKGTHTLLFALVEMRDLEVLVAKQTADAAGRTDNSQAKELFNMWSQESGGHRQALQQVIDKLQGSTRIGQCRNCMENSYAASYSYTQMLELLELSQDALGLKELYALAKKQLMIEGDVERRYAQMADMTDDEETKNTLLGLSKAEKEHHYEAQKLIDVLEKNYGDVLKEI